MSVENVNLDVKINDSILSALSRINNKEREYNGNLSPDLIKSLIIFGFDINEIILAHREYKFTEIEEACFFMMRDPETNLYNHKFMPKGGQKENIDDPEKSEPLKCRICKGKSSEHIKIETIETKENDKNFFNDKGFSLLKAQNAERKTSNNLQNPIYTQIDDLSTGNLSIFNQIIKNKRKDSENTFSLNNSKSPIEFSGTKFLNTKTLSLKTKHILTPNPQDRRK